MDLLDQSWTVSGEIDLESDSLKIIWPFTLRWVTQNINYEEIAVADGLVTRIPGLEGFHWYGNQTSAENAYPLYTRMALWESTIEKFHRRTLDKFDAEVRDAMSEVRIPVYGSPPQDWTTVPASIGSGLFSTGAVALGGADGHVVVLTGVGVTLFMTITLPVARALGDALGFRIRRGLGMPKKMIEITSANTSAKSQELK